MPQHHLAYHMISYHIISYHIISSPFILEWTISYYIFPGNLIPNPPKSTALQSNRTSITSPCLAAGFPELGEIGPKLGLAQQLGHLNQRPTVSQGLNPTPPRPRFFPLRKGPFQQERIQIPSYHVSICFTIFQLVVGGRQSTSKIP